MGLATNILRRGARYYVRLTVPKGLQKKLNRREVWRALGTSDPESAKKRAPKELEALRNEFARLQNTVNPTKDFLQKAVHAFYVRECEMDDLRRAALPPRSVFEATLADYEEEEKVVPLHSNLHTQLERICKKPIDQRAFDQEVRACLKGETIKHLENREVTLVAWAADEIIEAHKLEIERETPEYGLLCNFILRGQLEALNRAEERDRGKYDGTPTDPFIAPPVGKAGTPFAPPGESIMNLYEKYARDSMGRITETTISQNRSIVKLLAEMLGNSTSIEAIDRVAIRNWKDCLRLWPIRATEIREFRKMTFPEIVEKNKKLGKRTISTKTINKYLSAVGGFCTWLVANGYIEKTPVAEGMYLDSDKDERSVGPYTSDQLKQIFLSPVFTGARDRETPHLPGNVQIRDWIFWVPLIALFSGARLGEILQLHNEDIRQAHGRWIFHFTREGGKGSDIEKRTKTKGSQRVIPIHPELLRLGLIEYWVHMRAKGEIRLFPEVKPDSHGLISGHPSREWGRYLKKIGVKADKSVNFHSFRHGFTDALRRAGHYDHEISVLLGHSKPTTTGRYGMVPEGALKKRAEMIDELIYPDLDLSHLHGAFPLGASSL